MYVLHVRLVKVINNDIVTRALYCILNTLHATYTWFLTVTFVVRQQGHRSFNQFFISGTTLHQCNTTRLYYTVYNATQIDYLFSLIDFIHYAVYSILYSCLRTHLYNSLSTHLLSSSGSVTQVCFMGAECSSASAASWSSISFTNSP